MQAQLERNAFSARLKQVLSKEGYPGAGATDLAREFNRRFSGSPITSHAARKWLMGESFPAQEKIKALAQWFCVSAEWLRFGTGEFAVQQTEEPNPELDYQLMRDIFALSSSHQAVVRVLVKALRDSEPKV